MIHPSQYRCPMSRGPAKKGFIVTGADPHGRKFNIFALTREGAEEIERAAKRGDSNTVSSLLLAGK